MLKIKSKIIIYYFLLFIFEIKIISISCLSFSLKFSSNLYINYLNSQISYTEEFNKLYIEQIIKYIFENKIISTLYIGNPLQKMTIFFNNNENSFYLSKDPEINNDKFLIKQNIQDKYSILISSTYILKNLVKYESRRYNTVHFGQEQISFDNKSKYHFQFLIENDAENDPIYFGIVGLGLDKDNELLNYPKFLNQLYSHKIINNYYWYINYEENKLIIGEENDITNRNNSKEVITKPFFDQFNDISILDWNILFTEVYLNTIENKNKIYFNKNNLNFQANLNIDYGFIIGIPKYREYLNENFFEQFIKDKICFEHKYLSNNKYKKNYYLYSCNKEYESEIKTKFHTLIFISKEFNYTYELNYNDLFININNNKTLLFLVIFEVIDARTINYDRWILGEPFLKKYQFIFNPKKKTIIFKKKVENITNISNLNNSRINLNINIKIILIIFCVFVVLFLIFKYIKKYKIKNAKRNLDINKPNYKNNNTNKELELKDSLMYSNNNYYLKK